ncbi:MAG: orotate phosphoribosyltransferase [Myxococcales bacterium]|nr:orotate phosphoribosyltransferase [Myxococcales bacterium]|tara:strand:+ start:256 stop:834 length:579 start_codon:yes stop_codon:yes gene_type:complete
MSTAETSNRKRLFDLLKTLSYENRDVVLASGSASNEYVDCKQTALHPEGAKVLGAELFSLCEAIEAQVGQMGLGVGGMAIGADPLATATSLAAYDRGRHLPAYLVRKEPKSHGTQEYLEGLKNIPAGANVLMVEDVVTTGGSTLKAVERVRASGLNPIGVAVIIDREVGGMTNLKEQGLFAQALFKLSDFRE